MFECQKKQYCVISPKNRNSNYSVKINNEVPKQIGKCNKDESVKFLGIHV